MLELLSVEQSLACLQGKNKTMISTLDSKQKLTSDQKRQIESRQTQIDSVTQKVISLHNPYSSTP